MAGDSLKRVRPGDPLVSPPATFNTFLAAGGDSLRRQDHRGQAGSSAGPPVRCVVAYSFARADAARASSALSDLISASRCSMVSCRGAGKALE